MRKAFFFIFCVITLPLYSQKSTNLIFRIGADIKKSNIEISYFNGVSERSIADSIIGDVVKIQVPYYTEYLPLKVTYTPEKESTKYYIFFVNDHLSKIFLDERMAWLNCLILMLYSFLTLFLTYYIEIFKREEDQWVKKYLNCCKSIREMLWGRFPEKNLLQLYKRA